jgi:hypothetical protein
MSVDDGSFVENSIIEEQKRAVSRLDTPLTDAYTLAFAHTGKKFTVTARARLI